MNTKHSIYLSLALFLSVTNPIQCDIEYNDVFTADTLDTATISDTAVTTKKSIFDEFTAQELEHFYAFVVTLYAIMLYNNIDNKQLVNTSLIGLSLMCLNDSKCLQKLNAYYGFTNTSKK